jgi:hypothetical protein
MRLFILSFLLCALAAPSFAQRVVPDSSFGSNGVMVDTDDSVRMYEMRMALQPDGKIG